MSDDHDDYFDTPEQAAMRAESELVEAQVDAKWKLLMGDAGNRACIWPLFVLSAQMAPIANTDPMQLMQSVAVRDFMLPLWNRLRRVCPDLLALAERESQ